MVHGPVLRKITEALGNIFNEGRAADKVIEFHLRLEKRFGSHDRRFFAETVYGMVRWWRRLAEASSLKWSDDLIGAQWSPEQFEQLITNWFHYQDIAFTQGALPAHDPKFENRWDQLVDRASRASIPDWLDAKGMVELPDHWEHWLTLLNEEAGVYLRANTLVGTAKETVNRLTAEEFEVEEVDTTVLRLKKRANVFKSKTFLAGFFEMQDIHSQKIAELLQVQPGHRVVDACAGAGGKTLQLAALMKNKGQIIALDVHDKKLEELRRRARRAKTSIVEARWIESSKVIKRLDGSADRLLLDVPCSGSGVLRRNPDTKWKLTPQKCEELMATQEEILSRYSRLLKPGGKLVYSTCSIFPSENQMQVRRFLAENSDFKLEDEMILPPTPGDGFYGARLSK